MKISNRIVEITGSLASRIKGFLGIRDLFVFGGLAAMGWGLWMVDPSLSLIVVGALLFFMGVPFSPGGGRKS